MAVAGAERPPEGLSQPWYGFWQQALKAMKDQKSWSPEQRPVLDLYVKALEMAYWAEQDGRGADHDRHAKRAAALADQLALSPRGRRAVGLGGKDEEPDAFARFEGDELAKRRGAG